MDREFYTVEVINHLKARGLPFIIPCAARGRSGGIRIHLKGRESHSTTYTMKSGSKEATFQVNVVARYYRGKWNRHGMEYFAFAVSGIDIPVGKTHKEYRKRFGIETSYRLLNNSQSQNNVQESCAQTSLYRSGFSAHEPLDIPALDLCQR